MSVDEQPAAVAREFQLILLEKETGKKFLRIMKIIKRINIGHQHDRWMELKEAVGSSLVPWRIHVVRKLGHA